MRTKHTFYTIVFTVMISIVSLAFSLADKEWSNLAFSLEKLGTLLGVLISVLALVIGFYFVVIAINAYSHIEKIHNTEREVQNLMARWRGTIEEAEKQLQDNAETMFDEIEHQIYIIESEQKPTPSAKKRRNDYRTRKARLSYRSPKLFSIERRESLLRELAGVGDASDIIHIESILNNQNEPQTIKDIAKEVIIDLKAKFE